MKWSIPERIIERGRKYVREGRVTKLTQNMEQNVWYAEVIGSKIYHVELDGTPKENDVCTCPYWVDYGYCKHTVAVELGLREKGYQRVIKANQKIMKIPKALDFAQMFTDGFTKLQEKENEQALQAIVPLVVEVFVESVKVSAYHSERDVFGVSFKLGLQEGRTYVVKNAHDFLQAYREQGRYTVGTNTHLSLLRQNFSQEDQDILNDCLALSENNKQIVKDSFDMSANLKQRYVLLPKLEIKKVLVDLARIQRLYFKIEENIYHSIFFRQGPLPITFEIFPQVTGFKLEIRSRIQQYWESYSLVNQGSTFYELTEKQQRIYQTLLQLLKRMDKPEIIYQEEDVADLFAYVIPSLEEIGEVIVDEQLQTDLIRLPLKTKLSIYEKSKGLNIRVDYCYGDEVFSSDKKHATQTEKTPMVVRNQVRESLVESVLSHYQYTERSLGFQKKMPRKEELFDFFAVELPALRKLAEVELSDEISSLYLDALHFQPSIDVVEDGSWFDIRFDVTNIEESDVADVLLSLMTQQSFHQLSNGQILPLTTELFQQTSEALSHLRGQLNYQDGKVLIPKYRGLQVEEAFDGLSQTSFSEEFTEMVEKLTHPEKLDYSVPALLEATLRPYQIEGFRWLKMLSDFHFGGILADDMGLGKTIQTIAYLLSEKAAGVTQPSLIVAPASLIYNWQVECQKFAPSLKTKVITGSKAERDESLKEWGEMDVIITSYASLRQDIDTYKKLTCHALVLDEAQMIKNSETKTFQAIKEIKTTHRFALSGTPIENNLDELWSLFLMLMPGFFPSKAKFRKMEINSVSKMIQPFVLRREKKQVLKELPDKIESNLYSELSEEQKTVYVAHLRQMQDSVGGMSHQDFNQNRISILAGLTRLRQICCDPRLFIPDYEGDSGKLEQVKELVVAAKKNGRRVLLFSQFTSMLNLIEEAFDELELSSFYLRGSTKPKERLEMVEAFNSGEKDVFLISLKAGGTGLNLTGADTVILYDLWWNPAVEEQAAGRAHRMGQKKVVEVWRLIAEGTIEEKMYSLQQGKRELFEKVMTGHEDQQLAKLTEDDIREILRAGVN